MIFVTFHNENELPVYSNTRIVRNSNKCIKQALHLTENPVAFQNKCVYNVMGAEKNKRRESGICFFQAH